MELNDIQLPAYTLTVLYRNVLVEGEKMQDPAQEMQDTSNRKWLGGNEKNILICVNYADSTFLPDNQLNFLVTMLTACKLGIKDVAIINFSKLADFKKNSKKLKPATALLFGIDPLSYGLPVDFPMFQVQALAGTTFLYSPPLEELENDNLLKSKLWVSLRRLFSI